MRDNTVALGCGAKTGLLVLEETLDASTGAAVDAGLDAAVDAGPVICEPGVVTLERRRPDVLFVVDQSGSMDFGLRGLGTPGPTRWRILREALSRSLIPQEDTLTLGALFYPEPFGIPNDPSDACRVPSSVDFPLAEGNAQRIVRYFDRTDPAGGTPTAPALLAASDFFDDDSLESSRFVVLATDGAPAAIQTSEFTSASTTKPLSTRSDSSPMSETSRSS